MSPSTLSSRGLGLDRDLGGGLVKDLSRDPSGDLGRILGGTPSATPTPRRKLISATLPIGGRQSQGAQGPDSPARAISLFGGARELEQEVRPLLG